MKYSHEDDWCDDERAPYISRNLESKLEKQKHKIAVVGSGPAGLTCASDLAKLGYQVTIFGG